MNEYAKGRDRIRGKLERLEGEAPERRDEWEYPCVMGESEEGDPESLAEAATRTVKEESEEHQSGLGPSTDNHKAGYYQPEPSFWAYRGGAATIWRYNPLLLSIGHRVCLEGVEVPNVVEFDVNKGPNGERYATLTFLLDDE